MTREPLSGIDYAGVLAKHQVRAQHAADPDALAHAAHAGKMPIFRALGRVRGKMCAATPGAVPASRHNRARLEGRRAPLYQGSDALGDRRLHRPARRVGGAYHIG
jgi:hypothetical protein